MLRPQLKVRKKSLGSPKAERNVCQRSVYSWRKKLFFDYSKIWMSVHKKQTSAVLTPCAATPKGHITATVRQVTLATDEAVRG